MSEVTLIEKSLSVGLDAAVWLKITQRLFQPLYSSGHFKVDDRIYWIFELMGNNVKFQRKIDKMRKDEMK